MLGVVEISAAAAAINAEKRPKCHDCAKANSEAVMSSHPVLDLQTASNRRYLCACDACSVRCVLPGYIWTLLGLKQGCLLAYMSRCTFVSFFVLQCSEFSVPAGVLETPISPAQNLSDLCAQ